MALKKIDGRFHFLLQDRNHLHLLGKAGFLWLLFLSDGARCGPAGRRPVAWCRFLSFPLWNGAIHLYLQICAPLIGFAFCELQ